MTSDRLQVKWLLPAAYVLWRDVGLGGYTHTDGWDESWRGRQDGRNQAFADTLGHRSSETTRQIYQEPAHGLQIDLFLGGEDNEVASPREMLSWIASTSDQVQGGTSCP